MSARPTRSSSIPIPRNPASSARNIESLISIPLVPHGRHQPTSPSSSRPISEPRRVSTRVVSRAAVAASHGLTSTTPARTTARSTSLVSSVPGRSASRSFEPRIVRSSTADADADCPPHPSTSPTHTRRTSLASLRTASQRSIVPHVVARATPVPFPRPTYLEHSSLRHLLHTEIPIHHIPSRRADPSVSSRNQAYANALSTPSEINDDTSGSSPSFANLALHENSFKLPTRWSDQDRHPSLTVSPEGRELSLHGAPSAGEKDAASARTTQPIPAACGIFYYEVEILGKEPKSRISVGFAGKSARFAKLPGYEPDSWAYYGEEGTAISQERSNPQFSQFFGTGDVIGCGVDFTTHKAFFTKNGTLIGQAFENVGLNVQIFPSVGLQHTGDSIRTNFGQEPFRYDIDYHVQQQQNAVWTKILSTSLDRKLLQGCPGAGQGSVASGVNETSDHLSLSNEESMDVLNELIMSYLVHHGYARTARAFKKQYEGHSKEESDCSRSNGIDDIDMSNSRKADATEVDIELRTSIVNLVLDGDIDEAIDSLQKHHPTVLEADKQLIFFKLRLRKFVELFLATAELKKKMKAIKDREVSRWKADASQDLWMADEMGMDVDDDGPPAPPMALSTNSISSLYEHDKFADPELNEINEQYEDALSTAISYGQALSNDYHSDSRPELQQLFKKTFGIVAFEDPFDEGSGMTDIVGHPARIALAHEINQAILKSQGRPARPPLETLYRHTATCVTQLGVLGIGAAAFADMAREFLQ